MSQPWKPPVRVLPARDGAVYVTRIGRGWIRVPAPAWAAFTAAVKRGDHGHPR